MVTTKHQQRTITKLLVIELTGQHGCMYGHWK